MNASHLKIPFDNLEIYILSDGYFDIGSYQPPKLLTEILFSPT